MGPLIPPASGVEGTSAGTARRGSSPCQPDPSDNQLKTRHKSGLKRRKWAESEQKQRQDRRKLELNRSPGELVVGLFCAFQLSAEGRRVVHQGVQPAVLLAEVLHKPGGNARYTGQGCHAVVYCSRAGAASEAAAAGAGRQGMWSSHCWMEAGEERSSTIASTPIPPVSCSPTPSIGLPLMMVVSRISWAVAAARCFDRQASTTLQPALTSCRAVSLPIPEDAPVTMTTRPRMGCCS